jgi:hypothetical protein
VCNLKLNNNNHNALEDLDCKECGCYTECYLNNSLRSYFKCRFIMYSYMEEEFTNDNIDPMFYQGDNYEG